MSAGELGGYSGPERRLFARRSGNDRRDTMRWELDKATRRRGSGRRHDDIVRALKRFFTHT